MLPAGACVVLLILVDSSLSLVNNSMIEARTALEDLKDNKLGGVAGARRAYEAPKKFSKSTSSDSGDKSERSGSSHESLGLSFSESSIENQKKNKKDRVPKSSDERKGWKKWHRKCHPCPVEMKMKWRDSRIKWICGAFQRARRTFKSLCMMHYRNCQDGTMFVKIHDHRCENSTRQRPFGEHFFYEYRVRLPGDETDTMSSSSQTEDKSSS